MKVLNNQKGFTLIELIIVIVVLGVLAAVAIPQYVNLQQDAQAAANVGYVGGLRSTLAISAAATMLPAKNVCVTNVMSGTPTDAQIEGCVSGTRPTSLTQNAAGWQGLAPFSAAAPASVFWVVTAGTVTTPAAIACSSTTPAVSAPPAGAQC